MSFPNDICSFMVLVLSACLCSATGTKTFPLRAIIVRLVTLTTIVYWSFLCEILHYVFTSCSTISKIALGQIGHIASFCTSFSVTILLRVLWLSLTLSLRTTCSMCHVICHLIPDWDCIVVIVIWVFICIRGSLFGTTLWMPLRRALTLQCTLLAVASIVLYVEVLLLYMRFTGLYL